tara:strand:+ start:795 stop:1415 length:621 start_codon:yes stop_codon:yes gene_type:complete
MVPSVISKGAGLGVINTIATYPFDTVKTYYQVSSNKVEELSLVVLYRGCSRKLVSGGALSAIIFSIRDFLLNTVGVSNVICCLISGTFTSFLIHFIELNKICDQLECRTENVYFKTLPLTILKETLQGILFFNMMSIDFLPDIISGFLAGLITALVIFPIDTIRTVLVNDKEAKIGKLYDGFSWYLLKSLVSGIVIKFGMDFLELI